MYPDIKPFPGFIGGYNVERSIQIDNQRTLNMYVTADTGQPEQTALATLPGLLYNKTLSDDEPIRPLGLFNYRNSLYQVCGVSVYKDSSLIGTINTTSSPIWWAETPTQVTFSDGANLYVYDPQHGTFTAVSAIFITNPGPPSCINGRVIVPLLGSNVWYVSAINDATSYDQNRFALFNLRADLLMGTAVINNRLLLIGNYHTESWFPVATVSIPLNVDNNVSIDYGTWSSSSIVVATDDNGPKFIMWLAQDKLGSPCFILTEGTSAQKVSSQSIEILLQSMQKNSTLMDCYGISRRIDGHLFVEYNFPSANYTLVYDADMKIWTERRMIDDTYFIGNSAAYVNGTHYVGSRVDSTIYTMDHDYLTYYSSGNVTSNIHKQRISPIIRNPKETITETNYFEVKFETGLIPPNVTPYCWLQTSRDNQAFDNARSMPIGTTGQYNNKTYWYGLGANYSLVCKIDIYEPIRCFILGASLAIMEGRR